MSLPRYYLNDLTTYRSSTIYGQKFRWTAAAVARGVKPAIINRAFFSTVRPVGLFFFISLAMKVFLTPGKAELAVSNA